MSVRNNGDSTPPGLTPGQRRFCVIFPIAAFAAVLLLDGVYYAIYAGYLPAIVGGICGTILLAGTSFVLFVSVYALSRARELQHLVHLVPSLQNYYRWCQRTLFQV